MGKLVVNCTNRPPDEMIDVDGFGLFLNMHTHEVGTIDGTLVVGFELKKGEKPLPGAKDEDSTVLPITAPERPDPMPVQIEGTDELQDPSRLVENDTKVQNPLHQEEGSDE